MKSGLFLRVCAASLVSCTLAFASGCGFQLRGAVSLAPEFEALALAGVARRSDLGRELETALARNGGRLVAVDDARAILHLQDEQVSRRVLSVAGSGQASEYELVYRLAYRFEAPPGTPRGKAGAVELRRYYRFDPARVLAKADEEARLVSEMRAEAVNTLLRRLTRLPAEPVSAPANDAPAS